MTLQMYLLEHEMEAEDKRAEEIALNLIRMGLSYSDISEAKDLPLEKIQQLKPQRLNIGINLDKNFFDKGFFEAMANITKQNQNFRRKKL